MYLAVFADEHLGSDLNVGVGWGSSDVDDRHWWPTGICVSSLGREIAVRVRLANGVDEEVHRAAAHEAVLSREVFVQFVIAKFGVAAAF